MTVTLIVKARHDHVHRGQYDSFEDGADIARDERRQVLGLLEHVVVVHPLLTPGKIMSQKKMFSHLEIFVICILCNDL